jgi:xanthine dehydrogenase accessory factor
MTIMQDIYSEIVKALEKKERCVLATLISRVGSAPRAVGAKYLVKEDGASLGSIGGGCVEAEVWQEAQKVIEKREGRVLHFELTSEQLAEGGLVCGGNIDIFLEPLREDFLNIYEEAAKIRQKGGSAILATLVSVDGVFPRGEGAKVLIRKSGEKVGSLLGGAELEKQVLSEGEGALREKKPRILVFSYEDRRMDVLLEPVFCEPTVYVFGGGHVSEQVAPLAKKVHFKVVVIDDREIFANRERFPEADEVIVSEFEKCFDRLNIDESSYIVIITRGHLYDGIVLEQALKSKARYIGMIGSRKKIGTLYQSLIKNGIAKETLSRVHAPIGVDINSETPEEIAVSIVAELIKVRGESISSTTPVRGRTL